MILCCRLVCRRFSSMSQHIAFEVIFARCHQDIIGITFSDQKRLLATGGDDGFINMYDFRTAFYQFRDPCPVRVAFFGFMPHSAKTLSI